MVASVDPWIEIALTEASPPSDVRVVVVLAATVRPSWSVIDNFGATLVTPTELRLLRGSYDVAIMVLHDAALDGTFFDSLSELLRFDAPELVLVCDACEWEAMEVLRSMGFGRIISGNAAEPWLRSAVPHLAKVAKARRTIRDATRRLPPLPESTPGGPGFPPSPLALAETGFRERYLRGLLLLAGGRSRAARLAGVPYRTFNSMVRRLGIQW